MFYDLPGAFYHTCRQKSSWMVPGIQDYCTQSFHEMQLMTIIKTVQELELTEAVLIIEKGGLIAFPTDTVYGLAASVSNPEAINKLFKVKGRDFNKAIPILIGDLKQLDLVTEHFNPTARLLSSRFWPGALTLVVPIHSRLPAILSPQPTIGIRMPDHQFTLKLLKATGPLATTSANISGGRNPLAAGDVKKQLNGKIDLLIDGGRCPGGIPSTVVDCTKSEIRLIREGIITISEILDTLKK
jgi:L-threonylcarbamoyladenylate synthase